MRPKEIFTVETSDKTAGYIFLCANEPLSFVYVKSPFCSVLKDTAVDIIM